MHKVSLKIKAFEINIGEWVLFRDEPEFRIAHKDDFGPTAKAINLQL
ncbi:hypothetical protein [Draconibacterium orientale]|nr:hypothetical protein [Draconibacterium orientale]